MSTGTLLGQANKMLRGGGGGGVGRRWGGGGGGGGVLYSAMDPMD